MSRPGACLFASGFHLAHRSSGTGPPPGDANDAEDDWVVWESFLVLREPDPLSDGFDAWTVWFENIKACHDRLKAELEVLGGLAKTASGGLLPGATPDWASTKRSLY